METVETQDVDTSTTENKEGSNVDTPAIDKKVEKAEPYKSFSSKEAFDKHSACILNSAKNKAEKELLALLGLKPDEKDKLAKFKEAYDSTLSESEKQAKKLEEKLRKNRLTLSDYLDQLEQLQNMGDLSQIAGMLPGNMAKGFDPDQIDPRQFSRTKAIIQSMTVQERENPQILNASRKRRIAAGCGQQVSDVNRLLKSFEAMQQMTKALTRGGKRGMSALNGMMGGSMGGMHGFGRKKRLK